MRARERERERERERAGGGKGEGKICERMCLKPTITDLKDVLPCHAAK